MLSIIMPFFRKDEEFNFVLTHYNLNLLNHYPNLELIIVIDDPNHYESMFTHVHHLIEQQRVCFSLKIILNEQTHDWRPPCIAINVGIRHAKHEKLLVISPETIILPNSIEKLYQSCSSSAFAIGLIKFVTTSPQYKDPQQLIEDAALSDFLPYGSIMFTKSQANMIGGYDEDFALWGGDDDDFRQRLCLAGFKKNITFAKFLHINLKRNELNGSQAKKSESNLKVIDEKLKKIRDRKEFLVNNGRFGLQYQKQILNHVAGTGIEISP